MLIWALAFVGALVVAVWSSVRRLRRGDRPPSGWQRRLTIYVALWVVGLLVGLVIFGGIR
jgi:hypothetical protein